MVDSSIDPRLQGQVAPSMSHILNPQLTGMPLHIPPGQHPTSNERIERNGAATPTAPMGNPMPAPSAVTGADVNNPGIPFESQVSPDDWLNFDYGFENLEGLLGSSGADFSNELYGGISSISSMVDSSAMDSSRQQI